MDNDKLLKDLENGDVTVSEGGAAYVEGLFTVKKAQLIVAGNDPKLDTYPLKEEWAKGQICLLIDVEIKADEQTYIWSFADTYLDLSKRPACYPAYSKKGLNGMEIKRGKLLYELVHGIKQLDPKSKFADDSWVKNFRPTDLEGKSFNMNFKFINKKSGEESIILEDSFQKLKDEDYKKTQYADDDMDTSEFDKANPPKSEDPDWMNDSRKKVAEA